MAPVLDVYARGARVVVGAHRVGPDGRVVLLVDDTSPLATAADREPGGVPVLVRAARLRCGPGPDRVRTRVELLGRMTGERWDGGRALTVLPAHVSLDGTVVPVRRYRRAAPDPFAAHEAEELTRLDARPEDLLRLLGAPAADAAVVVPVGLDRYGLTLRVTDAAGTAEHRVPFPREAEPGSLHRTLDRMLHRP